ncbi:preprotein translocase subunit SecE [Portibacter lacus]|uniref:Protein translocase subunit SecE n=1 Tax=Portibacter lacus TaxID=1099794 RepID=A0AA37WG39_9BACT|nr:preprotein translocase subunit SecE [Portibacter lacus]GLR19438.1 protein translocase subunit SecE [Portibacter lacus]
MESLVLYVKESYNELVHKVTWPSWPSLLSSTRLVLVASVIIALIIFVMDLVFNGLLLQNLYKIKF